MYAIENRKKYEEHIYKNGTNRTLNIYIDGNLINSSFTKNISYNGKIFDSDTLSLGSALIDEIEIIIENEELEKLTSAYEFFFEEKITYSDSASVTIPLGYFYSLPNNVDKTSKEFTKFNLKTKFELMKEPFKLSDLVKENSNLTRKDLVEAICNKYDLYLATPNFINNNSIVGFYDDSIMSTTYLTMISERAGGFCKIGRLKNADGKLPLYIKSLNETDKVTIPIATMGDYNEKEKLTISKVSYSNGVSLFEKGDNTGLTIYLSSNNIFGCSQQEVDNIYNSLKGMTFQSLNVKSWGDSSIDIGDLITINGISTFAQIEWKYQNGFIGNYKSPLKEASSSFKISKIPTDEEKRLIRTEIDETKGTLKIISENVDSQGEQLADLLISFDEISTRVDTVIKVDDEQETDKSNLLFNNINGGTPIFIQIHPIDEEIGDGYPTPYKTPRPKLTPKSHSILRFHNITENEDTDYIIPTQLRVFNNVYDELYINYVKKESYVTKRIDVNEQGQLYVLENEEIVNIHLPTISLKNGDYKVSLLGYENAYLRVSLMIQNIYTTQFPTRDFVGSLIKQLRNSILLEVREGYIDKDDILAQINLAIEEGKGVIKFLADTLLIDTDNLKLDGIGNLECIGAILRDVIIKGGYINFTKNNDPYGYKTYINYQQLNLSDDLGRKIQFYLSDPDELSLGSGEYDSYATIQSSKGSCNINSTGLAFVNSTGGIKARVTDDGVIVAQSFNTYSNGYIPNSPNVTKLTMMYSNKWYLEVITNAGAFGLDAWESDKRLKKDIADTQLNALDIIMQIKHREFRYKVGNSELIKIGYVADELQEIDEQMIFEVGEDKIKQPSTSYIVPLLSKAIQEQQIIIKTQDKKINNLEQRISQLEKLIKGE